MIYLDIKSGPRFSAIIHVGLGGIFLNQAPATLARISPSINQDFVNS